MTRLLWLVLCLLATTHAQDGADNKTATTPGPEVQTTTQDPGIYKLKAVEEDNKALDPLYNMAAKFADVVAPKNPLIDEVIEMITGNQTMKLPEDYDRLLRLIKSEAGFLTCLAAGLLMFFGLGIAGFFVCCCRCCCGNCGGKKVQRPHESKDSSRKTYCALLTFTLIFMTAGIVCGSLAVTMITDSILDSEVTVVGVLDDTATFFNNTAEELNGLNLTEGVKDMVNKVDVKLDDIGDTFGQKIQNKAVEEIDSIAGLARNIDNATENMRKAETLGGSDVKNVTDKLQEASEELKKVYNKCKDQDACKGLDTEGPEINQVDVSFLKDLPKDIAEEVNKFKPEVQKLKPKIVEQSKAKVEDVKKELQKFQDNFDGGDLQKIINQTSSIAGDFPEASKDVQDVFVDIRKQKNNWYYGSMAMFYLVMLPVLLLWLGMCCGCGGHRRGRHPAERGGLSNCGGCTLMIGVYLLFFITGLPILATTLLFQVGGHVQTQVCSVIYEQDLKSFDRYFEAAKDRLKLEGDMFRDLRPSQTFKECENGSTLYKALKLDSIYNLTSQLDESLDLDKYLDKFDFDVTSEIHIPTDKVTEKVAELNKFNYTGFQELKDKVEQGFVDTTKLKEWIDQLKGIKDILRGDDLKNELQGAIGKLLEAQQILNDTLQPEWDKVAEAILSIDGSVLKDQGRQIEEKSLGIIGVIQEEATTAKKDFKADLEGIFNNPVDSVKGKIENQIGKCKQIWIIFDQSRHLVCKDILGPFNAYWFCLGWALFFSIFAIAFATKLSKHYYRMSDMTMPKCVTPRESQHFIPMRQDSGYHQNQGYHSTSRGPSPDFNPPVHHSYPPPPHYQDRNGPPHYQDKMGGSNKY